MSTAVIENSVQTGPSLCSPGRDEVIERLRAHKPGNEVMWEAWQLRQLGDGVANGLPIEQVADNTGWDPSTVKTVTGELGTWFVHSLGSSEASAVSADEAGVLFQSVSRPAPAGSTKRRRKQVAEELELTVVLGRGFERGAGDRRDVKKAYTKIAEAVHKGLFTDELIGRFLARKYPVRSSHLDFSTVSTVWKFAELGRIDDLELLNPSLPSLSAKLVAAYDLLDVARQDAINGLLTLATGITTDLDALRDACAKARWLATAEIDKILQAIEQVERNPVREPVLARELRFLAQRIKAVPARYTPNNIALLNEGHVRRIAEIAGLMLTSDRAEEKEIRRRLEEMGLGADKDQLIPAGVRAAQGGYAEAFWAALEIRVADPSADWREALVEAVEAAGN